MEKTRASTGCVSPGGACGCEGKRIAHATRKPAYRERGVRARVPVALGVNPDVRDRRMTLWVGVFFGGVWDFGSAGYRVWEGRMV